MKIGFLITARLKSSRLPLKLLKDLRGKKIIEWVIARAKSLKNISEIILCTSPHPQDYPLIEIARDESIYYFAGSEEDVLDRLYQASRLFSLDYFVGITGENPLFCRYYAQRVIDEAKKDEYDYIKIKGLPLGCAVYAVRRSAIELVCREKDFHNTEIWGYIFDQPELFKVKEIEVEDTMNRPHYRLTLDYKEDFVFLKEIFSALSYEGLMDLSEVITYIDKNQNLLEINRYMEQHDIPQDVKDKMDALILRLKEKKQGGG